MPRAHSGVARHRRVRKILKAARGYVQGRHRLYRTAKEAVMRAGQFAYRGRKLRKRDFRGLWILRIGAAAKANGLSYSRLIHGLKLAQVGLDRKALAELAVSDAKAFALLCQVAQSASATGTPEGASKTSTPTRSAAGV